MLNIKQGPDTTLEVEAYLQPRMGDETNPGYSNVIANSNRNLNDPYADRVYLPRYSVGRLQLPTPNEDLTCENIFMWEAVTVKTELIGPAIILDMHSPGRVVDASGTQVYTNVPIGGPNYHLFAVGGQPMDLVVMEHDGNNRYDNRIAAPPKLNPGRNGQVYDSSRKAKLDKDDYYPVELWHPDPFRNENTRYYATLTGGITTPPVLTSTNTVQTILLDENGVGPLCKGNYLYLSSVDIVGLKDTTNPGQMFRGLSRYFKVTLRLRVVKNPYPINDLINSLYDKMVPDLVSQPMRDQVEEVRAYSGVAPVAGDENYVRPECSYQCIQDNKREEREVCASEPSCNPCRSCQPSCPSPKIVGNNEQYPQSQPASGAK